MQILPLVNGAERAGLEALGARNADAYDKQAALFSDYLGDHLRNVSFGDNTSPYSLRSVDEFREAAGSEREERKTSASASTVSGASGAVSAGLAAPQPDLQKLKVGQEDFSALRQELSANGFTESELTELQEKIASPEGLTWGRLMEKIQDKITGKEKVKSITGDDKLQLTSFFQKLGFTPTQSDKLIASLERGEYQSVWGRISEKIKALGKDDAPGVTTLEAQTLARAMNLSQDSQSRLSGLFEKLGAGELSGEGAQNVLLALKGEIKDELRAEDAALKSLRELAAKTLVQAQKRAYGQEMADARQDDAVRKVKQAQAMAEDGDKKTSTVGKSAEQISSEAKSEVRPELKQALADQADQDVKKAVADKDAGLLPGAEKNAKAADPDADKSLRERLEAERNGFAQVKAKASGDGANAKSDAKNAGGQTGGDASFARQGKELGEQAVRAVADKMTSRAFDLGAETAAKTVKAEQTTGLVGTGANAAQTAMSARAEAQTARQAAYSRAAQQIQDGIFKNLGQGVKQLTLQLDPDDLGRLNLTLAVRDKEIQAVIKADNPEAAKALGDQLQQIKAKLEEQGLKVAKLEVQTGLSQDAGTAWNGAERHNEAQERQETMSRLRTAMRLLGDGGANAAATEAASVLPQREGLDIIA